MNFEKRNFPICEVRAEGRKLEGYAARFDRVADIGGGIQERIAKGAFKHTLANNPDILALADHDPSKVLARTKSKTLRLHEDKSGLAFSLDLPETQAGRDILALAQRGDLGGMSFGFRAIDESIEGNIRELREVDLFEISVVSAFPAYEGTTVDARSRRSASSVNQNRIRILELGA